MALDVPALVTAAAAPLFLNKAAHHGNTMEHTGIPEHLRRHVRELSPESLFELAHRLRQDAQILEQVASIQLHDDQECQLGQIELN